MGARWKDIGNVVVGRTHLIWALVWLHVVLIGLPFIAFATRGYETGWEDVAWLAFAIYVIGAAFLLLLAALGVAAPLVAVDAGLGLALFTDGPIEHWLLGTGFLLAATLAGIVPWIALRDLVAWWRKRRSVG
jgi:hypothetical protein